MTVTIAIPGAAALIGTPLVLFLAHRTSEGPVRLDFGATMALAALLGLAATVLVVRADHAAVVVPVLVIGTAAALVDQYEGRLPNALTGGLAAALLIAIVLDGDPRALFRASVVAGFATVVVVAVKAIAPDAIGWGDIKLLPSLAAALAWLGPQILYAGLVLCTVLLAITVIAHRGHRVHTVPYGPAFVVGALGALLAGI